MSFKCHSNYSANTEYGDFGSSFNKTSCNITTQNASNNFSNNAVAIASMLLPSLLSSIGNYSTESTLDKPTEKETSTEEVTQKEEEAKETPKDAVTRILKEAGIEADKNLVEQVAQKYPTMQAIKIAGLSLEDRVVNYAKGLKFDSTTDAFVKAQLNNTSATNVYTIENGEGENEGDKLKNGYLQFAQEQIELYDNENNGNGTINLTEYFAKELADSGIDMDDLTDAEAAEALARTKIVFDGLDLNKDNKLDKTEMAALSWVRSTFSPDFVKQNTTNFDTTFEEWQNTNNALEKFQEAVLNLPTDKMQEFKTKFDNGNRLDALLLLKENCRFSTEEFDSIGYFFTRYDKSVIGFVNHVSKN